MKAYEIIVHITSMEIRSMHSELQYDMPNKNSNGLNGNISTEHTGTSKNSNAKDPNGPAGISTNGVKPYQNKRLIKCSIVPVP